MKDTREYINHVSLIILASVAITAVLIFTRPIMVPFVISLFSFSVFLPVVNWLRVRVKTPHSLAILITLVLFFALCAGVILLVIYSIEEFLAGADAYQERLTELTAEGLSWLSNRGLPFKAETLQEKISTLPLFEIAQNISGGVFDFLGKGALVIIFVMFLLAGKKKKGSTSLFMEEIQKNVSKYIALKAAFSALSGGLVGVCLALFGVEFSLIFGIFVFLLSFIPSIGGILATLLPLPVILFQFGFSGKTFLILILISLIQFIIGSMVEPKVFGKSMNLHPVAVLFFLVFWGLIWGVAGMFLAVPITSVLKIVLDRIETTQPFSELLSG